MSSHLRLHSGERGCDARRRVQCVADVPECGERRPTAVAEEIYDIGDTWVFRFSAQGETSGEVAFNRKQLERNGWRLEIPASIGDELRQKGAPAPPP